MAKAYGTYLRSTARLLARGDSTGDLSALEILARECLPFLAAAQEPAVGAEHQTTLQQWFPGLAPRIVEYVSSLGALAADWRDFYVLTQLAKASENEWVAAWMCFAAAQTGAIADAGVEARLHTLVADETIGQLARSEALRSLVTVGAAGENEWRRVFTQVSKPLQTEMVIGAMVDLDHLPWLRDVMQDLAPASWAPRPTGELPAPNPDV